MRGTSSSNSGGSDPDRADGLAIRDGDRWVRLKWHKLRRRADDPPFHRPNLAAGLAAGAAMEVDIQPLADGGFVCLHDDGLEAETAGTGPVAAADRETIRRLRQIDRNGAVTGQAPLLIDELVAAILEGAAGIGDGVAVQLDLQATEAALSDAAADGFARLLRPVARHLSLSGEDWRAVRRLGGGVAGLTLGYDPTDLVRAKTGGLEGFAGRVAAIAPEAETIYLHHAVMHTARDRGIDLVGAFRGQGRRVDCWTIGTDQADAGAWLHLAVSAGVDQITTDTPLALQALWAARRGS